MNPASLLKFCDAQTKLLIDLIPAQSGEAEASRIDPLLAHLIEYCETGNHAFQVLGLSHLSDEIRNVEPISAIVRESVPRMIALLERARRLGREASQAGASLEYLDGYEAAADRFRTSAIDFLMVWPWANRVPWEKVAPEYERGEFQDAREALLEMLERARRGEPADQPVQGAYQQSPRGGRAVELE